MKIKYKEELESCWYRTYYIYISTVNDNYRFMGWICKYNKTDRKFEVFSSELGITKHNDCFKSLRAAKKFVKNRAQLHFEGIVNDENI